MATEKTDVVIVGVGAAGGILAAESSKAGMKVIGVPTANPRRLTVDRESVDSRCDGRFLQTDLVRCGRTVPVAGSIASRNPGAPTPA